MGISCTSRVSRPAFGGGFLSPLQTRSCTAMRSGANLLWQLRQGTRLAFAACHWASCSSSLSNQHKSTCLVNTVTKTHYSCNVQITLCQCKRNMLPSIITCSFVVWIMQKLKNHCLKFFYRYVCYFLFLLQRSAIGMTCCLSVCLSFCLLSVCLSVTQVYVTKRLKLESQSQSHGFHLRVTKCFHF